jgi:hypothetical protein
LETKVLKEIETEHFIGRLRADGIVHVHVKKNTTITLLVQEEMKKVYWALTDVKRPFVFTGDEFATITKEARNNAIEMEAHVPISSNAIIVKNLAQKIIADYYYKFNKPKNPYKVFKRFNDGIIWLHDTQYIPPLK